MPLNQSKPKRIGIIGCGAIGTAIALKVSERLGERAYVAFLNDLDENKAQTLASKLSPKPAITDFKKLIDGSDIVIESASATIASKVARSTLEKGKDVLIMSVGGLIQDGIGVITKKEWAGRLFLPSGAIGGLDSLKAIRGERLDEVVLRTRKPPKALSGTPYLEEKGIDVTRIRSPQVVFSGSVSDAVKFFPQNINVAASCALALGSIDKLRVEIYCDPGLSRNVHEVSAVGSFGRFNFSFENVASEENPKTSRLAFLSALATLEEMLDAIRIGT